MYLCVELVDTIRKKITPTNTHSFLPDITSSCLNHHHPPGSGTFREVTANELK